MPPQALSLGQVQHFGTPDVVDLLSFDDQPRPGRKVELLEFYTEVVRSPRIPVSPYPLKVVRRWPVQRKELMKDAPESSRLFLVALLLLKNIQT